MARIGLDRHCLEVTHGTTVSTDELCAGGGDRDGESTALEVNGVRRGRPCQHG
jgi:hypothetical protein